MERHNASTIRKASYDDSQERRQSNLVGNVRVSTNGSHYNIRSTQSEQFTLVKSLQNAETPVFIQILLYFLEIVCLCPCSNGVNVQKKQKLER